MFSHFLPAIAKVLLELWTVYCVSNAASSTDVNTEKIGHQRNGKKFSLILTSKLYNIRERRRGRLCLSLPVFLSLALIASMQFL